MPIYTSPDAAQGGERPPEGAFARLVHRLKHGGLAWLQRRLQSELAIPTTKPGRALHTLLRSAVAAANGPNAALRRLFASSARDADATLYAFYDLKVQPITYDVLWFVAAADLERRRRGLAAVHPVIVPGPRNGVREEAAEYEVVVDATARGWRIYNVLAASFGCLPHCTGFTIASSRRQAGLLRDGARHVYPAGYQTALPDPRFPSVECIAAAEGGASAAVLRAAEEPLRHIDRWLAVHAGGRRLVTITLRDYTYNTARNSNLASWAAFARELDTMSWYPVFVLDTERTVDALPDVLQGLPVFREVSWNVGLRAALYERAWLNLGINNGPMGLCWLNERTRYITFKLTTPSVAQATEAFNRDRGFVAGRSLPFATPVQKWVWEDDTLEVIRREFFAMVERIESCP